MTRFKQACEIYLSRGTIAIPFLMTIGSLVMFPLLSYYWLRENNGPALTPDADYRVQWISDADFRGLDRTDGPEYASENGSTTYAAGKTWQLFRPYYVSTPDGTWHMQVMARGPMTPYSFRAYLGAVIPALAFSIIGLVISLFGRKADSSLKDKGHSPEFQDLE